MKEKIKIYVSSELKSWKKTNVTLENIFVSSR